MTVIILLLWILLSAVYIVWSTGNLGKAIDWTTATGRALVNWLKKRGRP